MFKNIVSKHCNLFIEIIAKFLTSIANKKKKIAIACKNLKKYEKSIAIALGV